MPIIRIILVIAAIGLIVFVVSGIRKSRTRIEDVPFWMVLSLLILVLSIFPDIATWFSELLGFQAPINFLFLFFIAVLLVKCFTMSQNISELETKVKELTQQIAIEKLDHHERGREQSKGITRG